MLLKIFIVLLYIENNGFKYFGFAVMITKENQNDILNATISLFYFFPLDGKLVSLEEIWKSVPEVYSKRLEYEKWTFLTQQVWFNS